MIDENVLLTAEEKKFLGEIVNYWKTTKLWYEKCTDAYHLTNEEKCIIRTLIKNGLIDIKLIPSLTPVYTPSTTTFPFASNTVTIPLPIPSPQPQIFDFLFKPTQKGIDTYFVEAL